MAEGALLRSPPVLAGLSDEQRDRLAAQAREVSVAAGEWLLREGEEADAMYVIRSGRLDVISEGPRRPGPAPCAVAEIVGELAPLHAGRRTASIKAQRDTTLLEFPSAQF